MIAFLGMGLLGSNFVSALRKRELPVHIWNRSYEKAELLLPTGAVVHKTAAEAVAGANFVHLTLKDDQSVEEVLQTIANQLQPGTIIIDHTTTSVAGARERTKKWKEKGLTYVHAPVFMGPQNALEATGYMLISEDADVVSAVEPHLKAMTGHLLRLGPDTGKAAALKLIGNSFLVGFTGAIADTLSLAKALQIPSDDVVQLFQEWNPGNALLGRIKKITDAQFHKPTWELNMARKDTELFLRATQDAGIPLTVLPAIAMEMDRLIENGRGQDDWTVIAESAISGTR